MKGRCPEIFFARNACLGNTRYGKMSLYWGSVEVWPGRFAGTWQPVAARSHEFFRCPHLLEGERRRKRSTKGDWEHRADFVPVGHNGVVVPGKGHEHWFTGELNGIIRDQWKASRECVNLKRDILVHPVTRPARLF